MIDSTKEEAGVDGLRIYEVGYLLLPSIPEEKVPEHVTAIKGVITQAGGTFISEEDPTSRRLAYEMVKRIGTKNERFRSAYFGWVKFEVNGEELPAVKEKLDSMESILRSLIVKTVREDTYVPRAREIVEESEPEADASAPESSPQPESEEKIDNQSAE